jgi:1,4-dihydroxy-2-naphthoyl-CoA hydrolase
MTEQAGDPVAADDRRPRFPPAPLDQRMGIEYVETGPERVVARMPVEGNTQPFGLLHGGASCVLAESVGSVAANLHGAPDRYAVGVDINATHHRGVRSGHVTAVATPAHLGRSSASYEIVITDDEGRRVCTARLTCFLRPIEPGPAPAAG